VQDQSNATQQWDFGILGNGDNNFVVSDRTNSNQWAFGTDGNLTLPGNTSSINYANGQPYGGGSANTGNVTFDDINIIGTGNLKLQPDSTNASAYLDIFLTAGPDIHIAGNGETVILGTDNFANVAVNIDGNVSIQTGNVSGTKTWTFDTSGNLTLPLGSIVYETNIPDQSLSGSAIALKPAGGTTANQQLLIYPTANDGDHVHMTSGNLYATELFLGSDNFYVKLANTGNIVINSNNGNSSNAMWTFGTDGNLTVPGGGAVWTLGTGTSGLTANFADPYKVNLGLDYASNTATLAGANSVVIESNTGANTNQWTFDTSGNLTLPNGAVIKDTVTAAIAFGDGAGANTQGAYSVAVGAGAGANTQGTYAVAVGSDAGAETQGNLAVAIGYNAGNATQGLQAVAVGAGAGQNTQGNNSVAIGYSAGVDTQGEASIAIGQNAGNTTQGNSAVAIGVYAGQTNQGDDTVAIGDGAGQTGQKEDAVAIGQNAGQTNQGISSVAIGYGAGFTDQGNQSVAIGENAGANQGSTAVAIGQNAGGGIAYQNDNAVAIGHSAGEEDQGTEAVALGLYSGQTTQGAKAVAIGKEAGQISQGFISIAIGAGAGGNRQGNASIAIGTDAGNGTQGANAVAIGFKAGNDTQGTESIAIGKSAGYTNQANNSIILNATGSALEQTVANTFTVKPVRQGNTANAMYYDASTGEITYDTAGGGGNTGNVTFNDQAVIGTGDQYGDSGLYLAPGTESVGNLQYIRVRGGDVATHIHLDTGNNAYFDQYFGSDIKYVKLEAAGNVVIGSDNANGNSAQWTFSTDGNLDTPSNLVIGPGAGSGSRIFQYDEGLEIVGEGANSVVTIGWTANASAPDSVASIAMNYPSGGEGNVVIAVGNNATTVNYWLFDNTGNLRLPGNTFAVNYANGTQVSLGGGNVTWSQIDDKSGNSGPTIITLGQNAGFDGQGNAAIAIGKNAGQGGQGASSITIGEDAGGNTTQGANAVAIGRSAGFDAQGIGAVAIGSRAGENSQGNQSIAIGENAGVIQGSSAVAIGKNSGGSEALQGDDAVAIGHSAGESTQGTQSVAIGLYAGQTTQGVNAIAIGANAGQTTQGYGGVAVGKGAGATGQGIDATAIGTDAGATDQGGDAVAVGESAGLTTQGSGAVAVGNYAGSNTQGNFAVAIGADAGSDTQGEAAVAVGYGAGQNNQGNNSIILNATGSALDQTTADTFTVAPVRNDTSNIAEVMFYNTTSKEVTYGNTLSVAGNITGAYILGNGSGLTSLPIPAVAQDITSNGAMSIMTYDGNLKYVNYATVEPSTGNIAGGNLSTSGNIAGVGLNMSGNAVIGGNLTVNGTLTYINSTTLSISDPIINLQTGANGAAPIANSGKDVGTALNYYDTDAKIAWMGWDVSNAEIAFGSNVGISSEVVTFTSLANIRSGNASLGNSAVANYFTGNFYGTANLATYATTANAVALANVSGAGNIASLNTDGNSSNILYGNGVFASAPAGYGNSNVATFLASYGSNTMTTTGNVSVGNIIGNGQALTGLAGANVTGTVANATFATTAGTVTTAAQPNITSTGTLTSLSVTGNINAGNVTATTFTGALTGLASSATVAASANAVAGANVSGQVGNALVAGTVYTNAQPNITSVGTLTSLSVSGNANVGNLGTAGLIVATGNVTGGNLVTGGIVSATGNITGNFFIGNGNQLTSVTALNANVSLVSNNQEYSPLLATNTTGNLPFKASGGISWNPSTYGLTAGKILLGTGIGAQGVTGTYAFGANTAWKVQSQNGTNTDAQGQEIGRFGSEYTSGATTFWDSYTSYYQGSGASSGWMILNAAGNSVANVTGTGIAVTGTLSANGNVTVGNLIGPHANGNSNVNIATANGNVTITAVGNTTMTVTGTGANITGNLNVTGNITGNTNGFAIGYLNIPQIAAANATLALTDAGKHYYSTSAGNFTLTIPTNATVAFATGTAISIVVQSAGNVLVNAASGVTLYMAGNSTAGNRVASTYAMATLMKVASDTWMINGTGVA